MELVANDINEEVSRSKLTLCQDVHHQALSLFQVDMMAIYFITTRNFGTGQLGQKKR